MLEKLKELEEKLQHHSHDQTAIEIVQEFAKNLGNTKNRQIIFGSEGVILREHLATRHASLGLTGWRIFGSLLKTVIARTGESEVRMRSTIQ
ncbi:MULTISPECIES: hypothetical protein [unclassified Tolypothrix]|uniref:hypothetical protein n=1 Tax=unclassified Tolypothrix TaxID=2649714 RepID=UPI0005EAA312|nr:MULTISPECIES: hypothetical protein [unclassified Tolypothrix]BAY89587.1 hypothetical protein NIES3275_15900 [Microchaete diplosiphon NIES-3275]EKF02565.1 hypothetical protein FDUTEX481_06729 [Tolypothrix sp. PCC 7601]MBE9085393.1 hypothetical protein [Tolypothrix sp. LEGE 11397]UYD23861.1 hypothetical protein HGR01_20375 [Tolypothrix sp. PCC 7712]UYD33914.1 hypothetical protein HG267_34380 [Tolypothrix sp. PCC 7601]